jgi:hypothetical protein
MGVDYDMERSSELGEGETTRAGRDELGDGRRDGPPPGETDTLAIPEPILVEVHGLGQSEHGAVGIIAGKVTATLELAEYGALGAVEMSGEVRSTGRAVVSEKTDHALARNPLLPHCI